MLARLYTAPPQQNLLVPFSEVPPVSGMDGNVPLYNMPPGTAVYMFNLIPSQYGCRTREGYVDWAQNIAGPEVKSLVPFSGVSGDLSQAKLFAATKLGIYDVTTLGTDNPTAVVVFADTTDTAGFLAYHHVTDPSGAQTLYIADSRNGLYEYNPIGAVWTKLTTEITGVDPTKVAFVMGYKGRLWFIERDSADAWYLPIGQKTGVAVKFQFGAKMRHGGYLVGLYTYSLDGGDGLDDYLVGVSKTGEVLVYEGEDPAAAATWKLRGGWFIGEVPEGRRISLESGGDLLLLSVFGLVSISDLLHGIDPNKSERDVTGKIARLVREAIRVKKNLPYWEVKSLSEEGVFAINSPRSTDESHIQYVLNINRVHEGSGGGWGLWRGVPALTIEPYQGDAYFGTVDGKVCRIAGSLDGVDISGNGGVPVEFSMLGRYTDYSAPGLYKQVQWMRPTFIASNVVSYLVKAVYDFEVNEASIGIPIPVPQGGSRWDVGLWDQAIWAGTSSASRVFGGSGYGRNIAIALQGSTSSRATLANIDGAWEQWGLL